jgi:hypothetical protein
MSKVQFAVDQRQQGRSSWLRVAREKAEMSEKLRTSDAPKGLP